MSERLDRSAKRILLADDSTTYRSIAGRVLRDAGYQVVDAPDGATALELLQTQQSPFDLLILELNLPRVRGLDLLRRLRENGELKTRVLVVSESLTRHLRRVLGELRLDASLTKNHALRELLYQVDAVLFPQQADQRRSVRRLSHLPVNYWIDDVLFLESCFDVSDDGMFIAVTDDEPPALGSSLSLRFWLPNSDRLIVCEGEVMWLNTAAGDLSISHPPGMGVRFTRIEPADLELVRAFLHESR